MLLSLIVLASHLNPLGKLGNKIKYLTPDEQKYVIENKQPEGIDISELEKSIDNFKQNKLTLPFLQNPPHAKIFPLSNPSKSCHSGYQRRYYRTAPKCRYFCSCQDLGNRAV